MRHVVRNGNQQMTEEELTSLLKALHVRKSETRPSHDLIVGFYTRAADPIEVEEFVTELQDVLNERNAGTLEIFGIDEDNREGEFLIRCEENVDLVALCSYIEPLFFNFKFLENSYITYFEKQDSGKYGAQFKMVREVEGLEIISPSKTPVSMGCLKPLVVLFTIGMSLIALLACRNDSTKHPKSKGKQSQQITEEQKQPAKNWDKHQFSYCNKPSSSLPYFPN